jgi:ElaB/YqjD/DUF883 family membrane-anchored ribosome-binding protein
MSQATYTNQQRGPSRSEVSGDYGGNDERASFREQAGVVRDDVKELARAAGDTAVQKLDPVQEFVREKPVKSLLIAAGVGAVLGAVFMRR